MDGDARRERIKLDARPRELIGFCSSEIGRARGRVMSRRDGAGHCAPGPSLVSAAEEPRDDYRPAGGHYRAPKLERGLGFPSPAEK